MSNVTRFDADSEDHPRNAAAIRTAIMIGAEFVQVNNLWREKTIEHSAGTRSLPAWLFLAVHGLGIDENGTPVPFSKGKIEDAGPCPSYYLVAKIME